VFASSRLPKVPPPLMVCAVVPLSTILPVPVARPELKMFPETFRIFPPSLRVPATRFNPEETFTVFWVPARVRITPPGFVTERELRERGDEWLIVKSWADDPLNVVVFVPGV